MGKPSDKQKGSSSTISMMTVISVIGLIMAFIFHAGAAKLSYDRFGSIGWAFLAFIFGSVYYPYYAFFVSSSTPASMFGAMRKLRR